MKRTASDVLVYYPNLVGYARVLFMLLSFYFGKENPKLTIVFYLLAFGGDLVDGFIARKFNQCSKYGGVLDMVTDRVSTCGFLLTLSTMYTAYSFLFTCLVVLDISSHWFHVASMGNDEHHKSSEALENRSSILKWYYSIYVLFGYCCVGAEMFYVFLYVYYHFPSDLIYQLCFYVCLPGCVIKNIVNVLQLYDAAYILADRDANDFNKSNSKKK